MIIQFILSIPAYILSTLAGALPVGQTLPNAFTSGLAIIWNDIQAFSFVVPIDALLTCLGIALSFHLVIFGMRLFSWLAKWIPFIGHK